MDLMPTLPASPLAKLIARAMARQEGWLIPTSVQFRHRNPGNMMDIDFFKKTGQFRLNTFVSWEAGWEALATLIQRRLLDKKLTLLEFIGGLALIAGLLTRLASLGLAINMLGAILLVHLANGFFNPTGVEFPLSLLAATLTLVASGAGAWSLDAVLANRAASSAPVDTRIRRAA